MERLSFLLTSSHGHGHDCERRRVFECKTCSRTFPSFQALGGHRASHKRPRLPEDATGAAKPKMHGCAVCGLEFAVGQALGGHMRRHRAAGCGIAAGKKNDESAQKRSGVLWLDLNSPPAEGGGGREEAECVRFGLTFHHFIDAAPIVVDC